VGAAMITIQAKKCNNRVWGRWWWLPHETKNTKSRGHITIDSHIYKNVILVIKITKVSLWAQNDGLIS